jgi:hypothetical protein
VYPFAERAPDVKIPYSVLDVSGVKIITLPGRKALGTGAHPEPLLVPTQGMFDVGNVI